MPNDNINITPDMLKNLSNMLKSSKTNNSNNSTNVYSESNNSNNSANNKDGFTTTINENSNQNEVNIDFETILKMKAIVEKLNKKDDPRANLLYSLKPYLNKSRRQKIDKYANLLKISDVATLFKDQKKGDEN